FAHQLPTYLGAVINFIVNDPVLAFNIVCFIGIVLSNFFFYRFLRLYLSPYFAFFGTVLFNFAPYRIVNLFIRGAIPETFSSFLLPLALIGIHMWLKQKNALGFFLLVTVLFGLIMTHPMMLVTYMFIIGPYLLFMILTEFEDHLDSRTFFTKKSIQVLILFGVGAGIALGMAGYYVIPLNLEIKYFYYGAEQNHLVKNHFMHLANFFDPNWYYFYRDDIFPRGHFIKSGLPEILVLITGGVYIVINRIRNKKYTAKPTILELFVLIGGGIVFMTTQYAEIVYKAVSFLGNIQFPWRMMSAFIFVPPIIAALLMKKINKPVIAFIILLFFVSLRYPQLYGKNYTQYPLSEYLVTVNNLHSNNMNTIWTGETQSYPEREIQTQIIGGQGTVEKTEVSNSWRKYTVNAQTPVQLVDYTFYFPGWRVYVDGVEKDIQFQDPNYRGVITYAVEQGTHEVVLRFEDTKIRFISKVITVLFLGLFVVLFLVRKKLKQFILA
ncbi:MAG TPA: 6-pyruvoyl-tetrahydropterin synthase-related protein, partial [Candidatus Woesebacteria bacterium]|nr:6-pyruvoyl-tetrahydropterin synthase-related protein [Candidatus Woesebacteria bacterium]